MSGAFVHIKSVSKRYGQLQAVTSVDLSVRAGECVALVGHNGAGKSTLIKLILGLLRPDAGTVCVLGTDPASREAAAVRRKIGYLPENLSLYPSLTGVETLSFYARLKHFR